MKALVATAALAALAVPQAAAAQTADRDLDRAEAALNRIDNLVGPPAGELVLFDGTEKPKPVVSFKLTLPFSFNSNVANSDTNPQGALHGNPTASLTARFQVGEQTFIAISAGGDVNAFAEHSENDLSNYSGSIEISHGRRDAQRRIIPYAGYKLLSLYSGQYDHHIVTAHHFTLGARYNLPIGTADVLALDASFMRREASVVTAEQNRETIGGVYTHPFDPAKPLGAQATLGATFQLTQYTGGASNGRNDTNLRIAAGVSFPISDNIRLGAQISFQRNWSDAPDKDYTVWDAGPSLTFAI